MLTLVAGERNASPTASPGLVRLSWLVALGAPLGLAVWLRRRDAWPAAVALVRVLVGVSLAPHPGVAAYAWSAVGALALVALGV